MASAGGVSSRPRPGAAWVTGGALALVALLVAALAVAIFTSREIGDARERRNRIDPARRSLQEYALAVTQLSVDTHAYAIAENTGARARYEAAALRHVSDRQQFLDATAGTGYEDDAAVVVAAGDAYARIAESNVANIDRGVPVRETRVARGNQLLDAFYGAALGLETEFGREIERLIDRSEAAETVELVGLSAAAAVGCIVALVVIWQALRNQRLAMTIAEERRRISDVIRGVPGVVWEAWGAPDSRAQRIDFVSDYVEPMLGYTREEWLSTPNFWLTIVHPDDRERAAAEAARNFADGGGVNQFRWLTKDGRAVDCLAYSTVIYDDNGKPAGMRGVTLDVTDQKRAERALAFTAEATATLFSSLDYSTTLAALARQSVPALADWCAIAVVSDAGAVETVTVAHVDPARAEVALELQRRYPPEPDAPRGPAHVMRTGEPEIGDVTDDMIRRVARDEDHERLIRHVGLRSYIVAPMIARERTIGVLTLAIADSGRRYDARDLGLARDLALRAAIAVDNARLFRLAGHERARFESIVASVSHGILQVDAGGRIVYLNPAAAAVLGSNALKQDLHQALHGEACQAGDACELATGELTTPLTTWFIGADGRHVDVEIARSPIVVEGEPAGAVIAFQDITERVRQDRMKDDFLAFASHELRSPLTTVNGFAKWLLRRMQRAPDGFDDDTREAIDSLSSGTDQMANIIELFLDLTRIESDRLTLEPEPFDVVDLVREQVEIAARQHPAARFESRFPVGRVWAETDPARLRQVLSGLLDNAVKYGGDPPRVDVSVARSEHWLAIAVADNGNGIAPDDQPHIFDRFYRGGGGKKGLGIGLFVAREIIHRMRGSLSFETSPAGTTFRVIIPRAVLPSSNGAADPDQVREATAPR